MKRQGLNQKAIEVGSAEGREESGRAQMGAVAGVKARRRENKSCVWNYWGKSAQGKACSDL